MFLASAEKRQSDLDEYWAGAAHQKNNGNSRLKHNEISKNRLMR